MLFWKVVVIFQDQVFFFLDLDVTFSIRVFFDFGEGVFKVEVGIF